jgi:hypothetical protein
MLSLWEKLAPPAHFFRHRFQSTVLNAISILAISLVLVLSVKIEATSFIFKNPVG